MNLSASIDEEVAGAAEAELAIAPELFRPTDPQAASKPIATPSMGDAI